MSTWDPNHLGIRTVPELFGSAGYYTFNEGKNHYNFVDRDEQLYDHHGMSYPFGGASDGSEWSGRDSEQPFFGQIQLKGGKRFDPGEADDPIDPEAVSVPPYYPDHPVYREEIANHYDCIRAMDRTLADILAALERDGLRENTILMFFSDHGVELPRHKQFCYEGGIHVPLIMAGPGVPENEVRSDLVSGIDIGPTSLALAGIDVPDHVQGGNVFDQDFGREYVVAARDRCDYTIDHIRAVVGERYKYIRNFMPERPYLQPQYRDGWPQIAVLKELHEDGKLNEVQSRFVQQERPAEELYDLEVDPHETENLATSNERAHREALATLREVLHRWMISTDDQGRFPESDDALRAVVDRWGDDAVDPMYDSVREDS
jgi:arylsulfatase A-like enzyme